MIEPIQSSRGEIDKSNNDERVSNLCPLRRNLRHSSDMNNGRNSFSVPRHSKSISRFSIDVEKYPIIKKIRKFLDNNYVQIIMSALTLYILFADDIKNLTTSKSADAPFSSICIALMVLFVVELFLSSLAQEDYFLGFYFWLDLISLVSMLLDVHWFYDWLVSQISGSSGSVGKQARTIGVIAKAGKSAKIAARAIRILRILRIIRLVRVSKLYKTQEKMIQKDLESKEKEKRKEELDKEKKNSLINEQELLKEQRELRQKARLYSNEYKEPSLTDNKNQLLSNIGNLKLDPNLNKIRNKMKSLNLISTIIIIRLQGVVGSDLGVYIN